MLTGGKGIHVVVPLDRDGELAEGQGFAERFSRAIAEAEPERFTANIRKAKRKGRIFLDYCATSAVDRPAEVDRLRRCTKRHI